MTQRYTFFILIPSNDLTLVYNFCTKPLKKYLFSNGNVLKKYVNINNINHIFCELFMGS